MKNHACSNPVSSNDELIRRLAHDMLEMNVNSQPALEADWDLLSMMVEEAAAGVDIMKQHPAFYRALLIDTDLRQAFLDALESLEAAAGQDEAFFTAMFAASGPSQPGFVSRFIAKQHLTFQRTIEQLQVIFFPPHLAYRADPNIFEEPLFVLLREEFETEGCVYAIALRGAPSDVDHEALSLFLDVAVTPLEAVNPPPFPVQSSLHWGVYYATVLVLQEGQVRFPDISYKKIFADNGQSIQAGLTLSLEPGA